ncbi:MAG: hypothetical protein MJ199_00005, partial [Bacilli bacterium]|nr:hypothetical protein [Bacilli bacterium]
VKKLIDVGDSINVYALSQLKGLLNLKITDFYMTPLDKYAKTNLPVIKKDHLLRLYSHGEHVDPKLKSTYKPRPAPASEAKETDTKNEKYTQISMFDEDNK